MPRTVDAAVVAMVLASSLLLSILNVGNRARKGQGLLWLCRSWHSRSRDCDFLDSPAASLRNPRFTALPHSRGTASVE